MPLVAFAIIIPLVQFVGIFVSSTNATSKGENTIKRNRLVVAAQISDTVINPVPYVGFLTECIVRARSSAE